MRSVCFNLRIAQTLARIGLICAVGAVQAQSSYQYIELKQSGLSANGFPAAVYQVNNAGQVIGAITKKTGSQLLIPEYRFVPVYNNFAVVWSAAGTPTEVPIASSLRSSATNLQGITAINNAGVVVGWSATSKTSDTLPSKWVGNKRTAVDSRRGSARAINDSGVIVGALSVFSSPGELRGRATVWRDGQAVDLHALLGLPVDSSTGAFAVNAAGQIAVSGNGCFVITGSTAQALEVPPSHACAVVGLSDTGMAAGNIRLVAAPYTSRPVVWLGDRIQWLPTLPPPSNGVFLGNAEVLGMNKHGVVVGADQGKPVMWINGVQTLLNTPITGLPAGAKVTKIVSISDNGKLLVVIFNGSAGYSSAVLVPKP